MSKKAQPKDGQATSISCSEATYIKMDFSEAWLKDSQANEATLP